MDILPLDLRTIIPSPDAHINGPYRNTDTYVKYQPLAADGSDCCLAHSYVDSKEPNTALVYALVASNFSYNLAMASVNPHARVNHFGTSVFDPVQTYGDAAGNMMWHNYGGSDMLNTGQYASRMDNAVEASHLTFKFSTLNPGEVVQFSYMHLTSDAYEAEALLSMSAPVLIQPSDIISGPSVFFTAQTTIGSLLSCDFSLYGTNNISLPGADAWYSIGSTTYATMSNVSTCSIRADSTVYANGNVQLSVVLTTTAGVFSAERALVVSNGGTIYCFDTFDEGGDFKFFDNSTTLLTTSPCAGSSGLPSRVSFFIEYYNGNETLSQRISSSTSAPFQAVVGVSKVSPGTAVYIRAETLSADGSATTTVFGGVVAEGLSEKAPSQQVVGGGQPSKLPSLLLFYAVGPATFLLIFILCILRRRSKDQTKMFQKTVSCSGFKADYENSLSFDIDGSLSPAYLAHGFRSTPDLCEYNRPDAVSRSLSSHY